MAQDCTVRQSSHGALHIVSRLVAGFCDWNGLLALRACDRGLKAALRRLVAQRFPQARLRCEPWPAPSDERTPCLLFTNHISRTVRSFTPGLDHHARRFVAHDLAPLVHAPQLRAVVWQAALERRFDWLLDALPIEHIFCAEVFTHACLVGHARYVCEALRRLGVAPVQLGAVMSGAGVAIKLGWIVHPQLPSRWVLSQLYETSAHSPDPTLFARLTPHVQASARNRLLPQCGSRTTACLLLSQLDEHERAQLPNGLSLVGNSRRFWLLWNPSSPTSRHRHWRLVRLLLNRLPNCVWKALSVPRIWGPWRLPKRLMTHCPPVLRHIETSFAASRTFVHLGVGCLRQRPMHALGWACCNVGICLYMLWPTVDVHCPPSLRLVLRTAAVAFPLCVLVHLTREA